jgi:hypothetical protein
MDIWEDWLYRINCTFRSENRKILLLVDNAPSHTANIFENKENAEIEETGCR